jgi:hypothetical protein
VVPVPSQFERDAVDARDPASSIERKGKTNVGRRSVLPVSSFRQGQEG